MGVGGVCLFCGFVVVFFLACFDSQQLGKDQCSSLKPLTAPGPVQPEPVVTT